MTLDDERGDRGPVLTRLDEPRTAEPTEVSVVADPHLAVSGRGTWKVAHRSERRLRTAIEVAAGTDAVVFAGDLTNDGRRSEFERLGALLDDLSIAWTAIPGNHDVPKAFDDHRGLPIDTVRRRFVGDAETTDGRYPYVLRVGDLTLVCLNTAAPPAVDLSETWGGALGGAQRTRLREVLSTHSDRTIVAVAHHNLGPLPEHEPDQPWNRFPADDAVEVRALLSEFDIPLAVTGHHHVPDVRPRGAVTEIMAPAVCSFPQASLTVRVGPSGTTVRLIPLADAAGVRESYWHAAKGKPLGRSVLSLVTDRLDR